MQTEQPQLDPSTATHRFENEILALFGHPAVLERWCHLHGGFLTEPYRELEGSELDAAVRREARTVLEKAEDGTLSEALSEQLRPRTGDGGDGEWRARTRGICWRAVAPPENGFDVRESSDAGGTGRADDG